MFDGYFAFGGIEIVNAARTTAYLHNVMPAFPLVRRTSIYDKIPIALGDAPYRTPFLDGADWVETRGFVDPSVRNPTHEFYGFYPLSIEGIGDSTMSAEVIEGILDGGSINSERDATRSMRFHGLLIGADELAAEAGLTWLRNALRSNACGMHGDLCGYHDLRYFLAPPEVCDPLWTDNYNQGDTGLPMGALDPETSPLVYSHGVIDQPHRYEWLFPGSGIDGVKVRWGALDFDGGATLEEYGPLYLRRSNFILNPTFATDTVSWSVDDGTATRIEVGTRTFARFDQDSPVAYRTNWLPDPSFENGDPNTNGWRGSADVTSVVDGTAPQGTNVAVVPADVAGNWLEASMLGPYDPDQEGTLSFWKRHDADIVVTISDNTGAVIHTENLTGLADAWERVDVPDVPMRRDYVVRISTDGAEEIRVDGFLLEVSATMDAYFDGDTPDDPGSDTEYYFVPNPTGPSREAIGVYDEFVVETAETDAPFGPVVLTFDMRSVEATPSVLVEIIDPDDTVIGSLIVAAPNNWTRYALGVGFGRRVRVRFTSSTGRFDLDNVMLEAGEEVNDYFDGSSTPPPEYSLVWVGTPNNSISRMTWLGNTEISRRDNWRPFLYVTQGSLEGILLDAAWSSEIAMELQLDPYDRSFHRVSCTTGVKVIRHLRTNAGVAIEVDFVLTAATPHAFSTQPTHVFGMTADPVAFDDDDFPPPAPQEPIVDPDLPVLPTPPAPPTIPDEGVETITEWSRYYVQIPAGDVALWAGTVPTLTISTKAGDIRQVRVRFHPNPFEWDEEAVDPTSYCGEFILSYMPANSVLTVSGVTQEAWAQVAGAAPQTANHLLYGTGGTPMDWPELTCALPYVMTIDVPPLTDIDDLDFELVVNRRE